ncbi:MULTISPECIES: hypothetical protein [Bacillus]|uniref:hypothetical protein n=1 Tax=Bacillus TaxID=1386 RepID=UPI0006AEEB3C|nr:MULTISPECIES: hypothetical protein [Bacillus]AWD87938.1 hypothetical protein BVQ_10905 [Bacillus velezensis]KAF6690684.1 hypothetical protein G9362_16710 [Bacillus sp. EKM601B]KOS49125.1 hypothetical protein AN272_20090 [Bacillus amyloliquefaciens]MBA9149735.1 hypothetical protein [Bacillus sp. EKM213B]MDZ7433611.1 hypothetical protein [Bacillus amyloliquefaciens]
MRISDPIKETLVQNIDQLSSRVDELFIYLENELPSTSERQWKTIDNKFGEIFTKSKELQNYISCL